MSHWYRHSGVTIRSSFEVPEWRPFSCEHEARADVTIARSVGLPAGLDPQQDARLAGDRLVIDVPDAGRFEVGNGAISLAPTAGSGEAEQRLFLLGSAWSALGYRRGWAMMHGSAVEIGERAILLCGEAGAGKSTLAAALAARGHRLLSDDLCRADSAGVHPVLYPSAARHKLWSEALDHFDWHDRVLQRDHFCDDKFHLAAENTGSADPLPLGAVILLDWGEAGSERLRGGAAVRALADAAMYRKAFLELLGRMADHMVHCARIAAAVPVCRVSRPRDLGALETTCDAIEALLDRS